MPIRTEDYSGESYVVFGGASAPGTGGVLDLSALDGTNGFRLNGIDTGTTAPALPSPLRVTSTATALTT